MLDKLTFTEADQWLVLGWVLFGILGMFALGLGKLRDDWQPYVIGVALMTYCYILPSGLGFWLTGSILTLLLFTYRRFF